MNEKVRQAIIRRVENEPFARKFDLKLLELAEGHSKVGMTFTPDMENIFGMAHGGAIFALMDEAFETASNSHGTMAVALNMCVSFLATPAPGSSMTAEAREINRTNRTAVYEIRVTDDGGRLLATCQSLVYRKGTPLPFLEEEA